GATRTIKKPFKASQLTRAGTRVLGGRSSPRNYLRHAQYEERRAVQLEGWGPQGRFLSSAPQEELSTNDHGYPSGKEKPRMWTKKKAPSIETGRWAKKAPPERGSRFREDPTSGRTVAC